MSAARKKDERNKEKLQAELRDVTKRQDIVAAQVTERHMKGLNRAGLAGDRLV